MQTDLGESLDESNPYLKYGRNQVIDDKVRLSTSANRQVVAILLASLVFLHRTKPILKFWREFDESNKYMKF